MQKKTVNQQTIETIANTLMGFSEPVSISHLKDLLRISYNRIYNAIYQSDKNIVEFSKVIWKGEKYVAAKLVNKPKEVNNFKDVKLAWANGEEIQFTHNIENGWQDWESTSALNLTYADVWRVKPEPKIITVKQWEITLVYNNKIKETLGLGSKADAQDWIDNSDVLKVLEGPVYKEYEIEL